MCVISTMIGVSWKLHGPVIAAAVLAGAEYPKGYVWDGTESPLDPDDAIRKAIQAGDMKSASLIADAVAGIHPQWHYPVVRYPGQPRRSMADIRDDELAAVTEPYCNG